MIRIGNAQGFLGDSQTAPERLLTQQPNLDFLTMDYLAEVSMSILAMQKEKDRTQGYALDFVRQVRSLAPFWKKGSQVKVVVNAGGLNPRGCGEAVAQVLGQEKLDGMKVAVVTGDDVIEKFKGGKTFNNFDTGEPISKPLVTANAYLGAKSIAQALERGADIVITGRSADPSLTAACAIYSFNWGWKEYDKLAQATVAGHLIECGTQVTGGILTDWLTVPDVATIGYPVVEMKEDSSFVITKPEGTGGVVNEQTVKEQLLYELGDPEEYLSPDVTVSFLGLQLKDVAKDRIRVTGASGKAPPSTYKVSATYKDGYMAAGMLTLFGRHLREKAYRSGEVVFQRVKDAGYDLEKTCVECIGSGDVVPGVGIITPDWDLKECVLRIAAADPRKEAVECFAKELAPLVTSGPQGTTGYFGGRPKVRQAYGFFPCLIDASQVKPFVEMLEVGP